MAEDARLDGGNLRQCGPISGVAVASWVAAGTHP
jgi:hypothetical protein